jgi:hypothetical protein
MKFRIRMHSKPGGWKFYKGYVDVDAASIHQAVSRAQKKLFSGSFPNRPSGSWIVDSVRASKLAFEAEESRSG